MLFLKIYYLSICKNLILLKIMRILNILIIIVVIYSSLPSMNAQTRGKVNDWHVSMENARNNKVHDISLVSYELMGAVKDMGGEDVVLRMILADTMYTARVNVGPNILDNKSNNNHFSDFKIVRFINLFYGNMNYVSQNPLYYASEFRQSVVDKVKRHNLESAMLVKTVWNHRGDRYNSFALVSEEDGVLYDNIGSYIIVSQKEENKNSDPFYDNKDLVMRYNSCLMGFAEDIFGQEAYCYEFSYVRKFDSFNNFVDVEKDLVCRARSIWECDPIYEDNVEKQNTGDIDNVYMRVRIANPTLARTIMIGGSYSRNKKSGVSTIDQ